MIVTFSRSGSSKEKHLLYTKCFSYFVLETAFTFRKSKKFDCFIRFFSSYSFTLAHGHDDISIKMKKICDNLLARPLSVLFKKSFDNFFSLNYGKNRILYQSTKK